jgi:hypothetical protein
LIISCLLRRSLMMNSVRSIFRKRHLHSESTISSIHKK